MDTKKTIKQQSLELLCHVDFYEDVKQDKSLKNRVDADHPNAKSVGLSFAVILEMITQANPGCRTSIACLRWYAVQVRAETDGFVGYILPYRRTRKNESTR